MRSQDLLTSHERGIPCIIKRGFDAGRLLVKLGLPALASFLGEGQVIAEQ